MKAEFSNESAPQAVRAALMESFPEWVGDVWLKLRALPNPSPGIH